MLQVLLSMFITGLLFGSGPCLASCGPVLVSYIAGTKKNVRDGIIDYVLFSLARIAVYLFLGLMIFLLGKLAAEKLLGDLAGYIYAIAGIFIILIGIFFISQNKLELPPFGMIKKCIFGYEQKNVLILGLLYGLLPCAPFLAVLSYIGLVSKSWLNSLYYVLSFGLGTLLSPLLLLVIFAGFIPKFLKAKSEVYFQAVSFFSGAVIIFLGLQLLRRAF